MRKLLPLLILLFGCATINKPPTIPPCDSEAHIWGDGNTAYHLAHDALSPVVANSSTYTLDLAAWNDLDTPITLRSPGSGFTITVISGGDESSGWLGLASITLDDEGHMRSGKVTMNKSILDGYSAAVADHVLCQEVGHLLGLDHNRNDLDTCMNDCAAAGDWRDCLNMAEGRTPNGHDAEQLREIYEHASDWGPTPPAPCTGSVLLHTFQVNE